MVGEGIETPSGVQLRLLFDSCLGDSPIYKTINPPIVIYDRSYALYHNNVGVLSLGTFK
jgi:hypothetical protein